MACKKRPNIRNSIQNLVGTCHGMSARQPLPTSQNRFNANIHRSGHAVACPYVFKTICF
jgi:hypothetical protein